MKEIQWEVLHRMEVVEREREGLLDSGHGFLHRQEMHPKAQSMKYLISPTPNTKNGFTEPNLGVATSKVTDAGCPLVQKPPMGPKSLAVEGFQPCNKELEANVGDEQQIILIRNRTQLN